MQSTHMLMVDFWTKVTLYLLCNRSYSAAVKQKHGQPYGNDCPETFQGFTNTAHRPRHSSSTPPTDIAQLQELSTL